MNTFLSVVFTLALANIGSMFGFSLLLCFIICVIPATFGLAVATHSIPRLTILVIAASTAFIIARIAMWAGNSPVFPALGFFIIGGLAAFYMVYTELGFNPFTTNEEAVAKAKQEAEAAEYETEQNKFMSDPSRDKLGQTFFDGVDPHEIAEQLMYLVALRLITPDVFRRCAAHIPQLGPKLVTADTDNLRAKGADFDEDEATMATVEVGEAGLLTENEKAAIFEAIENYSAPKPAAPEPARQQVNPQALSFDPENDIYDSHLFRLAGTRMIPIDVFLRAMLVFNPQYEAWRAKIENFPEEEIHKGDANDAAELLQVGLITTPEFVEAMKVYDQKMKQAAS